MLTQESESRVLLLMYFSIAFSDVHILKRIQLLATTLTHSLVTICNVFILDFGVQPPACHILSFVETWVLIGVCVFLIAFLMLVLFINSKKKVSINER